VHNGKLGPIMLATWLCSFGCSAQEIWFSGVDPVVAADRGGAITANDFMSLFQPDAPWQRAASSIQVFKLSTQFLQRSSDEQLKTVIHNLQQRHIALAFEAEILVTSTKCGNGMPGFTTEAVIQKVIRRVTQAGGRIDDVAFDEPMTWGHFAHRGAACRYSVDELVRNMAPNIQALKAAFPAIRFGDIEPVTDQTPGRLADILNFATAFRVQTGEHLSFLQADLIWQNNWKPQLTGWKTRLRAAGIAYGVIVDGDPGDKTDIAWTTHAVERYQKLADDPTLTPDQYVFQSWQTRPSKFLPENEPGTLTSVMVRTVAKPQR
jgi:hypothetical protein